MFLQEGDFVDVEIRSNVITRGKGGNRRVDMQFAMLTIIQLKAQVQRTEVQYPLAAYKLQIGLHMY